LDQGNKTLIVAADPTSLGTPIVEAGARPTRPVLLDGIGARLAASGTPRYHRYKPYKSKPFANLPGVPT
jgi:hypothetical protein